MIENQVLVWLGTGMAPLLPALGAAANVLHFYTQKLLAMHLFVPPKKAFSASRTSTIAHGIMLGASPPPPSLPPFLPTHALPHLPSSRSLTHPQFLKSQSF